MDGNFVLHLLGLKPCKQSQFFLSPPCPLHPQIFRILFQNISRTDCFFPPLWLIWSKSPNLTLLLLRLEYTENQSDEVTPLFRTLQGLQISMRCWKALHVLHGQRPGLPCPSRPLALLLQLVSPGPLHLSSFLPGPLFLQLVCGVCSSLLLVFAQVFSETSHYLIKGCNLPQISFLALIFFSSAFTFNIFLFVNCLLTERETSWRQDFFSSYVSNLFIAISLAPRTVHDTQQDKYLLNDWPTKWWLWGAQWAGEHRDQLGGCGKSQIGGDGCIKCQSLEALPLMWCMNCQLRRAFRFSLSSLLFDNVGNRSSKGIPH